MEIQDYSPKDILAFSSLLKPTRVHVWKVSQGEWFTTLIVLYSSFGGGGEEGKWVQVASQLPGMTLGGLVDELDLAALTPVSLLIPPLPCLHPCRRFSAFLLSPSANDKEIIAHFLVVLLLLFSGRKKVVVHFETLSVRCWLWIDKRRRLLRV